MTQVAKSEGVHLDRLPLVVATGISSCWQQDLHVKMFAAEMIPHQVITKPFEEHELVSVVHSCIRAHA